VVAAEASLGMALPQVFLDGRVDAALVRRCARRAEEIGFSGLWVQEVFVSPAAMIELAEEAYMALMTRWRTCART
jgi:alkanesulfonate monooxygenase SsuD/methylene tetrahydromethanopterin reductase-like flavin-dependent oxidoreductase (luciferase family)